MRSIQLALIALAAVALAGCPKKVDTVPDHTAANESNPQTTTTATTGNTENASSALNADQAAIQELQKLGTIIYFDYDKSDIRQEYVPVLAANAKYLNGNAARKVRLEGNTDERGSREYNIGLGERRAQQVRRALMLQGVSDAQIVTVSYGEERPAVAGNDEAAYAKNRRVEIGYGP
jgi:peptidoglycan-associated lipoprotein